MLSMTDNDPICRITGNENYIFAYDPEKALQFSAGELKPIKNDTSNQVFEYRTVVQEFLQNGQTDNNEYYLCLLCRLRESIGDKQPELC